MEVGNIVEYRDGNGKLQKAIIYFFRWLGPTSYGYQDEPNLHPYWDAISFSGDFVIIYQAEYGYVKNRNILCRVLSNSLDEYLELPS